MNSISYKNNGYKIYMTPPKAQSGATERLKWLTVKPRVVKEVEENGSSKRSFSIRITTR